MAGGGESKGEKETGGIAKRRKGKDLQRGGEIKGGMT